MSEVREMIDKAAAEVAEFAASIEHHEPGLAATYYDLDGMLTTLADSAAPLAERAARYAILQQMRLRLDRALKANRDDIVVGMEREGLKELGPVSITSTAVEPRYPCNDRENWDDATVQDALNEMRHDPATRPYVRTIPPHFEIAVDVLTADVRMGVQAAIDLYRELNRRRWRVEVARRLSLAVREPKGNE